MSVRRPDPYAILGVSPDASHSEITTAYRRAVRACHPDAAHPDRERLAAVIAAYELLRDPDRRATHDQRPQPTQPTHQASTIPIRVHRTNPANQPYLRAGPVRYHPPDQRRWNT
jgi:curved DNA-binding protein CbpA